MNNTHVDSATSDLTRGVIFAAFLIQQLPILLAIGPPVCLRQHMPLCEPLSRTALDPFHHKLGMALGSTSSTLLCIYR